MLTSVVIKHFGSKAKTAKALQIGRAAVQKWKALVPPLRAAEIEILSKRKLRFDPAAYKDRHKPVAATSPESDLSSC
jgi:hypothetical protein